MAKEHDEAASPGRYAHFDLPATMSTVRRAVLLEGTLASLSAEPGSEDIDVRTAVGEVVRIRTTPAGAIGALRAPGMGRVRVVLEWSDEEPEVEVVT
jgi:hypothetical protein